MSYVKNTIAHQRITAYLAAFDDWERRNKEAQEAWERLVKSVHQMTDYDKKVFKRVFEKWIKEAKNAASSVD